MLKSALSVAAGILLFAFFILYIRAIRGETKVKKPMKASWIIWAILDTITLAGMHAKCTMNEQIIGSFFGAWIVFAFTLKYGMPGWTRLDKYCLGSAILAIVLWQIFNNPVFGIITSLIGTFIGSIPTFASAWENSSREDRLAWTIFWISCICAVISIPHRTLADAAQPITFLVIGTIMMFLLYIPSYEPATA